MNPSPPPPPRLTPELLRAYVAALLATGPKPDAQDAHRAACLALIEAADRVEALQ